MHIVSQVIGLSFAVFLAGCATLGQPMFEVDVDALTSPEGQQKRTYVLLPGNEGVSQEDLQFQEYAAYLRRALQSRGFVPAQHAGDADVAIVLSYGIGEPQTIQYTYSVPVWGQTGLVASQTYGTATTYGNSASYTGTTTYQPTYGVTGYVPQVGTRTQYRRYAVMTAYAAKAPKKNEPQKEYWRTTVTSSGWSGDLREVFPVMIAAATPYLATSTGKKVPVSLYENDNSVRAVKGQPLE